MRWAVVTGASSGIGLEFARQLAKKRFSVVMVSNQARELESCAEHLRAMYFVEAYALPLDLCAKESVDAILAFLEEKGIVPEVLVNNAGIAHIGLLMDMKDEEWKQILDTNLSSVFYCCRAAIPPMISRKCGRIINISSMWGTAGASCEAAYSASKAGVHGLTKAIAKELAPSNIQVNAIACGVIDTMMNGQLSDEERKGLEEEIPAGRYGTAAEIAKVVWDTAHAPEYLTGQIIGVDGGYL